jgi:hypothetical protein
MKESVVEMPKENARIKILRICYYLVDDSIDVTEEREMNSGIPQGPFIKRRKIKHESLNGEPTEFIHFNDLVVGKDINIFGKVISIYDCDKYTREFYEV